MAAPVTDPSRFAPRWPLAAVAAAGSVLTWVLLVPWDLGAQEAPWPAIFSACLVAGIVVLLLVSRFPNGALPAPVGALGGTAFMYAWRGAATGADSWPFVLIGMVIPLATLTCFAGSAFAISLVRRRDHIAGEQQRDDEPPPRRDGAGPPGPGGPAGSNGAGGPPDRGGGPLPPPLPPA